MPATHETVEPLGAAALPAGEHADNPAEGSSLRERLGRLYRSSISRFAAFGALGLAIDLTILMTLRISTNLPVEAEVTIAFATTYLINFFLNRRFSFHAGHDVSRQLTRFIPQVAADYLLTIAGVRFLTSLGVPILVARILSASTNAVLNYTAYRWWTFRPSRRQRQVEAKAADGAEGQ